MDTIKQETSHMSVQCDLSFDSCYKLKERRVRFWCLMVSQVFRLKPLHFPLPGTFLHLFHIYTGSQIQIHAVKTTYLRNSDLKHIPVQYLCLELTSTAPPPSTPEVTISNASVHHTVSSNPQRSVLTHLCPHIPHINYY